MTTNQIGKWWWQLSTLSHWMNTDQELTTTIGCIVLCQCICCSVHQPVIIKQKKKSTSFYDFTVCTINDLYFFLSFSHSITLSLSPAFFIVHVNLKLRIILPASHPQFFFKERRRTTTTKNEIKRFYGVFTKIRAKISKNFQIGQLKWSDNFCGFF